MRAARVWAFCASFPPREEKGMGSSGQKKDGMIWSQRMLGDNFNTNIHNCQYFKEWLIERI
ncbi:unnamed protein product [marine sediment metagenome]|uniref:Uncharacterized protein n=1 Tax=marine sediment metagenome TaxID=412755 RepID=X1T1W2_9ZZZZ